MEAQTKTIDPREILEKLNSAKDRYLGCRELREGLENLTSDLTNIAPLFGLLDPSQRNDQIYQEAVSLYNNLSSGTEMKGRLNARGTPTRVKPKQISSY